MAVALGRPNRSLSGESLQLLAKVSAVRNFLVHGDRSAKARIEKQFPGLDLHDILSLARVEQMFQGAEKLWDEAREITGQQVPSASGALVASDEFL